MKTFSYIAIVALLAPVFAGCDQELLVSDELPPPRPGLVQSGQRTVDLTIHGPQALRGLQAEVSYDASALRLSRVESGPDASDLDRVFWSDPSKANGRLVVGLSDTRRVSLPARGTLLRLTFEPKGSGGGAATVTLDKVVGSLDCGSSVALAGTSLALTVQ